MKYGYARVSTRGQLEGNSIEEQINAIHSLYEDAEIIVESYSGAKERPLFNRMLEQVQKDDYVIVTKLDRFCRSTIEGKIEPYYTRIGLTNLVLTVAEDHTFTMKAKMATLKGTITQDEKGELTFNFSALKKISLGKVSAKASKAGSTLILTFDVSKLISLMEKVSSITGNSSVKALSKMLSSYDGLYLGFKLKKQ